MKLMLLAMKPVSFPPFPLEWIEEMTWMMGSAVDGLYCYPQKAREQALALIIGSWNHVLEYGAAYPQALLFLEVMNWYDGIFIAKVWVSTSRFWMLLQF